VLEKMKAFADLMGEEHVDLVGEAIGRAIKQLSPIQRKELIRDLEQVVPMAERRKMFQSDWHDPVATWLMSNRPKAIR